MTLVPFSPPEMYQFSIVETAPVGTAIGRVKAEDSDVGENTDMTYQVKDEEGVEMFKVTTDSNTQEAVIMVQKVRGGESWLGREGTDLWEDPFLWGLLLLHLSRNNCSSERCSSSSSCIFVPGCAGRDLLLFSLDGRMQPCAREKRLRRSSSTVPAGAQGGPLGGSDAASHARVKPCGGLPRRALTALIHSAC